MKSQVGSDHYSNKSYDAKERFISYWHQINEIRQLNPAKMLEVGIGNGFVTSYLRDKELNVTGLDIAYDLKPDVVGSVLAMPFIAESFDLVACYEVLEHLPYEDFLKALRELARVSQEDVVLSLPDVTTV